MEDGRYRIVLNAGGLDDDGVAELRDALFVGHQGAFSVVGRLEGSAGEVAAMVLLTGRSVQGDPDGNYILRMTGLAAKDHLLLTGLGPSGIQVELEATRIGDLTD